MNFIKQAIGLCLLLVIVSQNLIVISAQSVSNAAANKTNTLEDKISRVENGLIQPFRIKGEKIEKWTIAERMKHYKVPGVSVAVINNGKVEWAKGYGETEAGTGAPVTADTLFQAASISKPVASTVALRMVQDKKLSLDDDVNNKLVSWKVPESEYSKEKKNDSARASQPYSRNERQRLSRLRVNCRNFADRRPDSRWNGSGEHKTGQSRSRSGQRMELFRRRNHDYAAARNRCFRQIVSVAGERTRFEKSRNGKQHF